MRSLQTAMQEYGYVQAYDHIQPGAQRLWDVLRLSMGFDLDTVALLAALQDLHDEDVMPPQLLRDVWADRLRNVAKQFNLKMPEVVYVVQGEDGGIPEEPNVCSSEYNAFVCMSHGLELFGFPRLTSIAETEVEHAQAYDRAFDDYAECVQAGDVDVRENTFRWEDVTLRKWAVIMDE